MSKFFAILTFILFFVESALPYSIQNVDYLKVSQDLLYAIRVEDNHQTYVEQLKNASKQELLNQLSGDNQKKAFWLNIYNAYTQILLKEDVSLYENRSSFFKTKHIIIAGMELSLDNVEHDFLRRSKTKWSMGYVGKMFVGKKKRQFTVKEVDYRIHFALNCGAKSCPPIAFYKPEKLDQQLDLATKSYLRQSCDYDKDKQEVQIPKIMSWFRADFGGISGIRKLLKAQNIIPEHQKTKVRFKKYDWSVVLDNYQDL